MIKTTVSFTLLFLVLVASLLVIGILADHDIHDKNKSNLRVGPDAESKDGDMPISLGTLQNKQQDNEAQERLLKSSKLNVVVEFKSQQGKEDAMKLARKVLYESKLFDVVAMEINSKYLPQLRDDPNILRVDIDEKVHAFPLLAPTTSSNNTNIQEDEEEDQAESKEKKKKRADKEDDTSTRDLQESTPWGVRAVQADQVLPGPNPVKVCIVDTGYDYNHEDLPISGVTGTDSRRYSSSEGFRWNEDGEGIVSFLLLFL